MWVLCLSSRLLAPSRQDKMCLPNASQMPDAVRVVSFNLPHLCEGRRHLHFTDQKSGTQINETLSQAAQTGGCWGQALPGVTQQYSPALCGEAPPGVTRSTRQRSACSEPLLPGPMTVSPLSNRPHTPLACCVSCHLLHSSRPLGSLLSPWSVPL